MRRGLRFRPRERAQLAESPAELVPDREHEQFQDEMDELFESLDRDEGPWWPLAYYEEEAVLSQSKDSGYIDPRGWPRLIAELKTLALSEETRDFEAEPAPFI